MADSQVARDALQEAEGIPIAQLQPEIANAAARLVEGEVTITWPFSIVTKSVAFKLVESDFRLRLNKGQVRVDFHGAAGKAVAKAAIGGGDQIQLCLEGVEFEKSSAPVRPDTLDWQLKFTNRLRLKICRAETREEEYLQVDASDTDQDEEAPATIPEPTIEPSMPEPVLVETLPLPKTAGPEFPSKRLASTAFDGDELASPAFVKRAKASYGSLFEGGLDFLDDETKRVGKKKRSRFSMHANWRYNSRTPSPEPEHQSELDEGSPEEEPVEEQSRTPPVDAATPTRPPMVDESCQTQVVDGSPSIQLQSTSASVAFGTDMQASPAPFQTSRASESDGHMPFMSMPVSSNQDKASGSAFFAHGHSQPFGSTAAEARGLSSEISSAFDMSHSEAGPSGLSHVERGTSIGAHGESADATEPEALAETHIETDANHFFNAPMNFDIPPQLDDGEVEERAMVEEYPNDILSHPPSFAPSQLEQSSWSALTSAVSQEPIHDSNDLDNAVEIIDSSSPPRAPSPSHERHDTKEFEDQQSEVSASEKDEPNEPAESGYVGPETANLDDDQGSVRSSVEMVEEPNEDGGDLAGEDYDLRNYDRAQDDDVVETDGDSEEPIDPSDPDQQIVDLQEESDESEESAMEEDEWDSNDPRMHKPLGRGHPDEEDDVDADGEEYEEDYEEEEDYPNRYGDDWDEEDEEEDYDEEEEQEPAPKPVQSQEPVFISLLSDSEDGDDKPEEKQDTTHTLVAEPLHEKETSKGQQGTRSPQALLDKAPSPVPEPNDDGPSPKVEEPAETAKPEAVSVEAQGPEVSMDEIRGRDHHTPIDKDSETGVEEAEIYKDSEVQKVEGVDDPLPETSQSEVMDTAAVDEQVTAPGDSLELAVADTMGDEDGMDLVMAGDDTAEQLPAADDSPTVHETKHAFSSSITTEVDPDLASRVKDSISQIANEELEDSSASEKHIETTIKSSVEVAEATQPPPDAPAEDIPDPLPEVIEETMGEPSATLPSANDQQQSSVEVDHDSIKDKEGETEPTDTWSPPLTRSHDETHTEPAEEESKTPDAWSPPHTRSHDEAPPAPAEHLEKAPDTWSPPVTRSHDEAQDAPAEDDSKGTAAVEQPAQLPTPGETQREEDTIMHDREDEPTDAEISFQAEQQIMTESQAHESSSPAPTSTTNRRATRSKAKPKRQRDILITADSLRSADHRKSGSSPATDDEHDVATGAIQQDKEDEEQPAAPTPRIMRSKAEDEEANDPSSKTTRTRKRKVRQDATPEPMLETPRTTRQLRSRSKTPEPTAPVLEEPSVAGSAVDNEEASALKARLTKDLRTELPTFLPLKSLRGQLHKTADFIGVSTMTPGSPYRPQGGPRDYILELILTDPASAPSSVTVVSIMRHFKDSLPSVQAGDVVLLRHFEVLSMKGRGFGLRVCDESAWAVFEKDDEELLPQIKGAPVEVSDQEFAYAEDLRKWWSLVDSKAKDKIEKATQKAIQAPKEAMKAEKAMS